MTLFQYYTLNKSKKALVNITYELDNLIAKNEIILEKSSNSSTLQIEYAIEIIKEIKTLYQTNQLRKIESECLDNLKYAYSLLVLDSFKEELNKKPNTSNSDGKGVVIDVTEE